MDINALLDIADCFYSWASTRRNIDKLEFNAMRHYQERVHWLEKNNFTFIDEGSSRAVYLINPGKVLKLAKNAAGVAQNKVEFDVAQQFRSSNLFPKTFDKAPDNSWIEVELIKPLQSWSDVFRLLGIDLRSFLAGVDLIKEQRGNDSPTHILATEFNRQNKRIEEIDKYIKGSKIKFPGPSIEMLNIDRSKLDSIANCLSNKKFINLLETLYTADLPIEEFDRFPDQFGQAPDGRLVIADAGYNTEVGQRYYRVPANSEEGFIPPGLEEDYKYPANIEYTSRDPRNVIQASTHHGFDPSSGEKLRPSFENGDLVRTGTGRIAKYLAPASWSERLDQCIIQFLDSKIGKYVYWNENDLKLVQKALPEHMRVMKDPFGYYANQRS